MLAIITSGVLITINAILATHTILLIRYYLFNVVEDGGEGGSQLALSGYGKGEAAYH